MNKKAIFTVISLAALVAVIGTAALLYNYLSQNADLDELYVASPDNINPTQQGSDVTNKPSSQPDSSKNDEAAADDGEIIQTAPDFVVYDKDGNEVSLNSMLGKPVVMNFWATWCGPCKSELPAFEEMYAKYKNDVNFMMINVTDGESQTREIVDKFVDDYGYSFPVYYDETIQASYIYGASSIPLTVFVYPDGALYGGRVGAMQKTELEYYIKDILEAGQ